MNYSTGTERQQSSQRKGINVITAEETSFPSAAPKKGIVVRSYLQQMGIEDLLAGVYTEISINRPGEIWTEGRRGWERHEAPACTPDACKKLVNALAVLNGTAIKAEAPIQAVVLPDGQRGHALVPPACEAGTVSLTIRIPSQVRYTIDEYVEKGLLSDYRDVSPEFPVMDVLKLQPFEQDMMHAKCERDVKRMLELGIKNRLNIVLCGGTGSGKTTLNKAIADMVPFNERIGTIEDTSELTLPFHANHEHLFFGDTITAKSIVKSTLRMKFDRVFLAELRGDETWDYLTLLNTGTPGGITTVHCNGARHAIARIATLVKQSEVGQTMEWKYLVEEVTRTVDLVLFMKDRKLAELWFDPVSKNRLMSAQNG